MTTTQSFMLRMVECVPSLEPLVTEHIEGVDSMLPHVLMGDVGRWVDAQLIVDPLSSEVQKLFELVNAEYVRGAEDVQELIAVSFAENLTVGSIEYRMLSSDLMLFAQCN